MHLAPQEAATSRFVAHLAALAPVPANAAGAIAVYLYFSYIDPIGRGPAATSPAALTLFAVVTLLLLATTALLGARWTAGVRRWAERIRQGSPRARHPRRCGGGS